MSTSKRHEVALVHPDHLGAGGQGQLRFGLVVHFDEGVEPEMAGQFQELAQLGRRERSDDQQQGVGAHQPGVTDVGGADREVLAQDR